MEHHTGIHLGDIFSNLAEQKRETSGSNVLSFSGSPLQFYVDAINSGHVTAFGPGLSHGTVNRPATFTIVTKDAGEGTLAPPPGPAPCPLAPPPHLQSNRILERNSDYA